MKNYTIAISIIFLLVFMPIALSEESKELREAKTDISYIPQDSGTGLKIALENTGKVSLEAMTLKIFYDGKLSEQDPVSIEVGENKTFNYIIPKGTNVAEFVLSRGGLGMKFSKATIGTTGQNLSTTLEFSEEFFTGLGDVYDFDFDFEMTGKPIEIEQNEKATIELKLKNTGTMDLDIRLDAESELEMNYEKEVSLKANKTKTAPIEVFAGNKVGNYKLYITGKTRYVTKTLPLPVEINVIEKLPLEPIIKIIKITHDERVYVGEETKVVVQMKNIGLGREINVKLDVPEKWEVEPAVAKEKIDRFDTVDVIFYIVPHTSGTEQIKVNTDYGSGSFEITAGRSLFSYLLIFVSLIIFIIILILTNKLRLRYSKDYAAAVVILLIILYVTCWKSFILFLWVIAFLIAVPVLIYSYYKRRKAEETGGLRYVKFKA